MNASFLQLHFLTINLVLKIESELATSSLVQSSSIEPKYLVS